MCCLLVVNMHSFEFPVCSSELTKIVMLLTADICSSSIEGGGVIQYFLSWIHLCIVVGYIVRVVLLNLYCFVYCFVDQCLSFFLALVMCVIRLTAFDYLFVFFKLFWYSSTRFEGLYLVHCITYFTSVNHSAYIKFSGHADTPLK